MMEEYKKEFISFLLVETGALKIIGDFSLKSKRLSPWFVDIGEFSTGEAIAQLGKGYASGIKELVKNGDVIFGPAYKGISLAITTSIALAGMGKDVNFAFDRKEAKDHGEATDRASLQKSIIVGAKIKDDSRVIILDDVFTTGDTKYEAIELLGKLADNLQYPCVGIAVDRQEVATSGKSAIEEFTEKTGIKVVSAVNALDVIDYFSENLGGIPYMSGEIAVSTEQLSEAIRRMSNYLRVYGTNSARKGITERFGNLEQKIISRDRSVIPACDISTLEELEVLAKDTADVDGIGGYKTGISLALRFGLPKVVEAIRKYTDKPIIHDNQKAGTDIPEMGKEYAKLCKEAGVDAVILFPQAGPETERAWIYHALDNGLKVIVGGRMTHPAYSVSEGGFITDEGAMEMYRIAARAGITDFVVPGNKVEVIRQVREIIEAEGVNPVFYAPGFVEQGGKIAAAAKAAGDRFHGIVGRGIYKAKNMKEAAIEHASQL